MIRFKGNIKDELRHPHTNLFTITTCQLTGNKLVTKKKTYRDIYESIGELISVLDLNQFSQFKIETI